MKVEVKKITYTPEKVNDKGEITKDSCFSVQLEIPNTAEVKEMLTDVMLVGESGFIMELEPIQGHLGKEVAEGVENLKQLGVTEARRE